MSGPCLSSSVAGRPLRPATRLSLGGLLPRQLADRPRAYRKVPGLTVPGFTPGGAHWVLARLSTSYSQLRGK